MLAFSLLVGFGATLGLWQVASRSPEKLVETRTIWGLIVLTAALVGARAAYVVLNLNYFDSNRLLALAFWEGGLAWPGAVVGGLLACLALALWYNLSPLRMADHLSPLLPPVSITAWLGCWLGGCSCSIPSSPFTCSDPGLFAGLPLPASLALLLLSFFFTLEKTIQKHPPLPDGRYSAWGLLGFGVIQMVSALLLPDHQPVGVGYFPNAWAAVGCMAISLALLLTTYLPQKKTE